MEKDSSNKSKPVQFNVNMPADLIAEFTAYCAAKDLNRSAVMRTLIANYIAGKDNK